MSTDTTDADNDLRERITNFLRRNFPQIQMHGGSAAISHLDRESGEVTVQLGGACSGCGSTPTRARAPAPTATSAAPAAAACHPPSPARRPTTAATTKAPGPVLSGSPDLAASFSPVFRTQIAIRSSVRYLTRL